MRAVFVDCTEDLAKVIKARGLRIPECHVFDHALAEWADGLLGHRDTSCLA